MLFEWKVRLSTVLYCIVQYNTYINTYDTRFLCSSPFSVEYMYLCAVRKVPILGTLKKMRLFSINPFHYFMNPEKIFFSFPGIRPDYLLNNIFWETRSTMPASSHGGRPASLPPRKRYLFCLWFVVTFSFLGWDEAWVIRARVLDVTFVSRG